MVYKVIYMFVLGVVFARASLDPLLSLTQAGGDLGGGAGAGAAINLSILIVGVLCWTGFIKRGLSIDVFWAPFLVVLFIGVMRSPEQVSAMRLALNVISYAAIFTCGLVFTDSAKALERNLRTVILSYFTSFFFSLYQLATGLPLVQGEPRLQASFAHPNILAFYILLVFSACLFYRLCATRRIIGDRWVTFVMLTCIISLVLTQTRSSWIAMALQLAVVSWLVSRRLFFATLSTFSLSLLLPVVQSRLISLGEGNEFRGLQTKTALNSYAWRKALWESALNDLKGNWLFGRGFDSFPVYAPKFFVLVQRDIIYAHNVFVQLIYETGLVGLVCYLAVFAALIYPAVGSFHRNRVASAVSLTVVIGHLVCSYSDNMLGYLSYEWYFWFVMGAVTSAFRGRWFRQEWLIAELRSPKEHDPHQQLT